MSRRYGKKWGYSEPRQAPTKEDMARLESISKSHIAARLTDFGFTVTDISKSSPFDLLATFPHYSLAVNVRHRWSKSRISIHRHEITARIENSIKVDDKILVFCTPQLADCYISLSRLYNTPDKSGFDIYVVGEYYVIERYTTNSLSALRKILESSEHL